MIQSKRYANSLPGGIAVLQAELYGESCFVPLRRTRLKGEIGGPLADLTLEQTFRFDRDDVTGPVEAVYRFPLPGEAAVTAMEVRFADERLRTSIVSKDDADKRYDKAFKDGRDAAMLNREAADVYALRINGLRSGEDVTVVVSLTMVGEPEKGGFRFRVPLTTAPRFTKSKVKGSDLQPYHLLDPGHCFSMEIGCKEGSLCSTTHVLRSSGSGYALQDGEVVPDRDMVLSWSASEGGPRVLIGTGKRRPFLAMVSADETERKRVARDVIVLVDHSGSMSGAKWEAADWAVERFLSGLGEGDVFNLCTFHSTTRWFSPETRRADGDNVDEAKAFLSDRTSGGTQLDKAIDEALNQSRSGGEAARHLLVITDGQVSQHSSILKMMDDEKRREDGRRCSVICIDSAPNDLLVRQMAKRSGGTAHFLTSSPQEGDITSALDDILDALASPLATGLHLMTNVATNTSTEDDDGNHLTPLPDMVPGRVNWVTGVMSATASDAVFTMDGREIPATVMKGVNTLHAILRMNELEMLIDQHPTLPEAKRSLKEMGFSVTAVRRNLSGVKDSGDIRERLRSLLVSESLRNKVLCRDTALVAEGTVKGERSIATIRVPSAIPHGWDIAYSDSSHEMNKLCSYNMISTNSVENMILMGNVLQEPNDSPWELFDGVPEGHKMYNGRWSRGTRRFHSLVVSFQGTVEEEVDGSILLFIGDMSVPRIRVHLKDLLRSKGRRPLNLIVEKGERVRLELEDGGRLRNSVKMKVVMS